ncbi:MAG: hypothetical protein WD431_25420 [Cyclobacteriaceae bacterium]
MDLATFKESTRYDQMPVDLSIHLQALWLDKKGEWAKAHHLVDTLPDEDSAFLHAYLHRKEGDQSNAAYWYQRAGKKKPDVPLDKEWENMARYFLEKK